MRKKDSLVKRIHIDNTEEELKRLDAAKERTMTQLAQLYEKALQEVGEVNAAIFEVHQMMLEDDDYQDAIHSMIQNEEVNAEYAVAVTGDNFAEMRSSWQMTLRRLRRYRWIRVRFWPLSQYMARRTPILRSWHV